MLFLIQDDSLHTDKVQNAILTDVIEHYEYSHSYKYISIDEFYIEEPDEYSFGTVRRLKNPDEFEEDYSKAIPFGTIGFVNAFLKSVKGIDGEIPIEIPPVLREERFLKRKYGIMPPWEVPREGKFFLKDASQMKGLKYKGELSHYVNDSMFEAPSSEFDTTVRFNMDHLYQVSEIVSIDAEYRVYVLDGVIDSMFLYNGDPLCMPDADLIREAHKLYSKEPDSPKSYSFDVMVNDRGTSILEVHTFNCLGLYSVNWDEKLLFAMRDAMDYIENFNTPQTEYANF